MRIAIDFDDTLTADPRLWGEFIHTATRYGHSVICVTARRETEENIGEVEDWLEEHGIRLPVYYTNLGSKVLYTGNLGIRVDIWIDDDPKSCVLGR